MEIVIWGSIVDLFRTKIIEAELRSLVDSIKLIFEKFDIDFDPIAKNFVLGDNI